MPAPWDWAAHQPFELDQNVAIIADPYVEESNGEIASDISRDSFLPEQLPEASFELEPTGPAPPRTIQTRTQTALEQGIPRQRFSHFGYLSDSESDREVIEPPVPDSLPQAVFPELDDLEPLYSDQEDIRPEIYPTGSLVPSPSETSAALLSNPSLTDTLSDFPLFESRTEQPSGPEILAETETPQKTDGEGEASGQNLDQYSAQPSIVNHRGRPQGRPPGRRGSRTTPSNKTTALSRGEATRPRRGPRTRVSTRPPPRTLGRSMTLPEIPESQSPERTDTTLDPSSRVLRYQLRTNRAPRYKCRTVAPVTAVASSDSPANRPTSDWPGERKSPSANSCLPGHHTTHNTRFWLSRPSEESLNQPRRYST